MVGVVTSHKYPLLRDVPLVSAEEDTATFSDEPAYNAAGDCLVVFLRDEKWLSDRVDSILTVFRSQKTNEIIGCSIKGVSLLAQNVVSMIGVDDGKIKLTFLLLNAAGRDAPAIYLYELPEKFKNIMVPANLFPTMNSPTN